MRDLESVPHLIKLLEDFKEVSGLEISKHKTEAMWLGSWRNCNDKPFGFKWPQDSVHALGVHFSYDPQLTDKVNFEEKIRTLEQTLQSWKRRKLTLLGKINIVKALGLAKLIYSTSLLTISKPLIDRINKIIFNFIWDGKTPKIKKKTIIAEIKHGGLKMIDFEIMERSLKIAWIKRFIENSDAAWKAIPNHAVSQLGGLDFLIKCDYDLKLLNLDQLPEFYRTILCYWQEFELLTDNEEKPVRDRIIWNNCSICLDGKPIFISDWFKKGIIYIKDLLNTDLNFLSLAGLKEKYRKEFPFAVYYGLLNAIPKEWKIALHNTTHDSLESASAIPLKRFSTKLAYSKLLEKRYSAPTAEPKLLNHGFTKENIQLVYTLPFRIMKEANLTTFQLKIIHGILPTQYSLFRAGLASNDKCSLYNLESQSLTHMFLTCCQSSDFWTHFTNCWQISFSQHKILSKSVILYGWHQDRDSNYWTALNYCIIIAKYHIFSINASVGILDFEGFLSRLKDKLVILRTLAVQNNQLKQFKETWAALI